MPSPQPFKNRPSRVCPLSHPSQALPYPIPRLLSRPRCAWRWGALAGLPQRAGHAGRAMDAVWPPAGGAGGRAAGVAAPKGRLNFQHAFQAQDVCPIPTSGTPAQAERPWDASCAEPCRCQSTGVSEAPRRPALAS
jgi:hypothetical protein